MGVGPERVACCRVARFGVDHVAAGAGVGGGRATGSLGSLPCRSGTAAIGQRPNRYQGGIRARNALTPEPGPMHFDFVTTSGPSSDFGRWPVTVTRCDGTNSTPTPGATSKRAEPTHRMRRRGVDEWMDEELARDPRARVKRRMQSLGRLRHGDGSAPRMLAYGDWVTPDRGFLPELSDFRSGRALALHHAPCGSIAIIAQF
jgi:hypothetical protein